MMSRPCEASLAGASERLAVLRPLLAPGRIEIASLIAYVAGTGASFVTNAAFTIDGGLSGLNDGRAFKTLDDLITQCNHRAKRRNSLSVLDRIASAGIMMHAEAHGKPNSVRQDRRWFLMQCLLLRAKARLRDTTKPLCQTAVGALTIGILRTARYFDPIKTANLFGRIARSIGPMMREQKIGRANLTAAFPEKSPAEIEAILAGVWDNLGRVGAEFAHLARSGALRG